MDILKASKTVLIGVALVTVAAGAPSGRSTTLAVPNRSNANPSIAANGTFVAITWGATTPGGPTDVYSAVSRDGGRTFGSPAWVNDTASQASLSGEQPPRVTLVPRAGQDPSLVVVWTAKSAAGTRLWSARSDDGGRRFTPPALLPGSEAPGNRGWESIATDRDGHVVAVWLDHREVAGPTSVPTAGHPTAGHTHAVGASNADGVARAQQSQLFFARLGRADSARALTGGVCYCCKTAVATAADGAIYAAWRHVYPGSMRDIALAASRDGGRTFAPPIRVSEDRWALDGCPENGPALAVDENNRVHVVWPTVIPGTEPGGEAALALFYAVSSDGRRFTPRQRIPTAGIPWHPHIAVGPGGAVVVTWDELAGGSRRVAFARGGPRAGGSSDFTREVLRSDGPASHPVVASTDEGLVLAWTTGSARQTRIETESLRWRQHAATLR